MQKSISLKYEPTSVGLAAYVRYRQTRMSTVASTLAGKKNWSHQIGVKKIGRERALDIVCQHQEETKGDFSQRRDVVCMSCVCKRERRFQERMFCAPDFGGAGIRHRFTQGGFRERGDFGPNSARSPWYKAPSRNPLASLEQPSESLGLSGDQTALGSAAAAPPPEKAAHENAAPVP